MTEDQFYLFLERIIVDGEKLEKESKFFLRNVFSVRDFYVTKYETNVMDLKTNQSYPYGKGVNISDEAMKKCNIIFPIKNPGYYSCFLFKDSWSPKNATCMHPERKLSQN